MIAAADWVIDMGPEAGAGGGRIVVEGPPEDLVIHAERWRRATVRPQPSPPAPAATTTEALLRSHTGEALEAFLGPQGLPRLPDATRGRKSAAG